MREATRLAGATAFVVMGAGTIAHASPQVAAKLVCTAGAHRITDGDRAPIAHDVVCEIDADVDAALAGQLGATIDADMAVPLGGTARSSATVAALDKAWRGDAFGVGSDLLRCADTAFHARLIRGDEIVWEKTLRVKPSCPKVRFERAPTVACSVTADGVTCRVAVAHPPHGVALVAYVVHRVPVDADPSDPADRLELGAQADGSLAASLPEAPLDPICRAVRVDAALARDGGVVWTGHTTYQTRCKPMTEP
jgi:hypothetical protein